MSFFLELFRPFFLFLPLQIFLEGSFLGGLDLLLSASQELVPHFFLALGLLCLELKISLFVSLSAVGVVAQSRPGHRGRDVFDFFDSDRGQCVVSEFHRLNALSGNFIKLILYQ